MKKAADLPLSHPEPAVDLPWPPIDIRLLDSTVWTSDLRARVLWITVLLLASQRGARGTIDMPVFALAKRANLSVEDTEAALAILTAPDPQSRYQEDGGRRLIPSSPERAWGWRVSAWRERQADRERARAILRVERHRAKKRAAATVTVP